MSQRCLSPVLIFAYICLRIEGGVNIAKKAVKSASKGTTKQHKNSVKVNQSKAQKLQSNVKEAKQKYGGKSGQTLRDEKLSKTENLGNGIVAHVEVGCKPKTCVYATQNGVPVKGAGSNLKHAAKTGFWKRR